MTVLTRAVRACTLTTVGLALVASALSAPGGPPLLRPTSPRPAFKYEIQTVLFDNVSIPQGLVSDGEQRWVTELANDWTPELAPAPGFSLTFTPQAGSGVTLSATRFSRSEFLPDLGEDSWMRYLAGLRQEHGAGLEILEDSTTASGEGRPFLNYTTRSLVFRVPRPGGGATLQAQLLFFARDNLYLFVLSGGEAAVRGRIEDFYLTLCHTRDLRPSG